MVWKIDDDNHHSSLSGEDTNSDGNIVGCGAVKKGPWTPEEDTILTDYIKKHGEGNWNAVQKFSGLNRCGKSCRLRWVNHLRPDLKKGGFTPEEEDTIIRLHAKLGNKWARIAAELPGRTDNEIKNFFNTRKKRLERAGNHMYPDDVLNQNISHESQKSPVSDTLSNELHSSQNLMDAGILGVPVFKIEHSLCSELYSELYSSKFPGNNMLPQDLVPSYGFHYPAPTIRCQKRLRESDASNGLSDTATSSLFTLSNCNAHSCQPYELPPLPEYYCGANSNMQVFTGSHALINGMHSTSIPSFGSVKLELPSLQSSDSDCSFWDPPISPLPSVKCTDTLLQSPEARPSQLDGEPDTDGLLESLVWPSKKVMTSVFETDPIEKATTGNLDDPLVDISEPDWEAFADSILPMGSSSTAAIFNDLTVSGFSFDELQSTDDMLAPQAKPSDADPKTPPTGIRSSNQNHNRDSYQPDSLLNANLLSPDTKSSKDYLVLQEAISALKGDKHHL